MNCLLFRRSCSLLTELGKDQELTVPTFKPAALRQMAGKVSQPCSPNLFSQQAKITQQREKGPSICKALIPGQETAYVWGALQWTYLAAHSQQSLLLCQDPQGDSKGMGFTEGFAVPELQQERRCSAPPRQWCCYHQKLSTAHD